MDEQLRKLRDAALVSESITKATPMQKLRWYINMLIAFKSEFCMEYMELAQSLARFAPVGAELPQVANVPSVIMCPHCHTVLAFSEAVSFHSVAQRNLHNCNGKHSLLDPYLTYQLAKILAISERQLIHHIIKELLPNESACENSQLL